MVLLKRLIWVLLTIHRTVLLFFIRSLKDTNSLKKKKVIMIWVFLWSCFEGSGKQHKVDKGISTKGCLTHQYAQIIRWECICRYSQRCNFSWPLWSFLVHRCLHLCCPDIQWWDQESQGTDGTKLCEGCEKQQKGVLHVHWIEDSGQGECSSADKWEGRSGNICD